jgi:hypothetical protein
MTLIAESGRRHLMVELGDGVRRLFDGPNMAHLATVLPDRSPHIVGTTEDAGDGQ